MRCSGRAAIRRRLPPPLFKKGILKLEDLTPGTELRGKVLNVVDFGVFLDIGLKESGLVHISQLSPKFIRSPHDVVTVGQIVTAWVLLRSMMIAHIVDDGAANIIVAMFLSSASFSVCSSRLADSPSGSGSASNSSICSRSAGIASIATVRLTSIISR